MCLFSQVPFPSLAFACFLLTKLMNMCGGNGKKWRLQVIQAGLATESWEDFQNVGSTVAGTAEWRWTLWISHRILNYLTAGLASWIPKWWSITYLIIFFGFVLAGGAGGGRKEKETDGSGMWNSRREGKTRKTMGLPTEWGWKIWGLLCIW